MSLKLFRSTGYSSILAPGETRVALHPGWLIAATSAWIGLASNVALWRELLPGSPGGPGPVWALGAGLAAAGLAGIVLSLLGWRRTLKPAATLLLLASAVIAAGIWARTAPLDATLLAKGPLALLPPWTSLLNWQVLLFLVLLGLLPMLWVWQVRVRRLPGPSQLSTNIAGMVLSGSLLGAAAWLLLGPS